MKIRDPISGLLFGNFGVYPKLRCSHLKGGVNGKSRTCMKEAVGNGFVAGFFLEISDQPSNL